MLLRHSPCLCLARGTASFAFHLACTLLCNRLWSYTYIMFCYVVTNEMHGIGPVVYSKKDSKRQYFMIF